MKKVSLLLLLGFTIVLCASEGHTVAVVHGRRILASEIAPPADAANAKKAALTPTDYRQWRANEERTRLQERIWCEIAVQYVKKRHLAPSSAQVQTYEPAAGAPRCTPFAALSTEIFDASILQKYGGTAIDARAKYLADLTSAGKVKIADPAFADVLSQPKTTLQNDVAAYSIGRLADDQMRIDCASGTSVVIRRRPDGRWSEEVKVRAGAERVYASAEEAAAQRCSQQ
jgi:hypothetical protein